MNKFPSNPQVAFRKRTLVHSVAIEIFRWSIGKVTNQNHNRFNNLFKDYYD